MMNYPTETLRRPALLKLSGEVLGNTETAFAAEALTYYAQEIAKVRAAGHLLAVVVGGGNLWRGKEGKALGMLPASSDGMGMLATLMNGLALTHALQQVGCQARLLSQLGTPAIAPPYTPWRAKEALATGHVVILGGGMGKPFFTTDTAASHAALALGCGQFLKGTKVDGVYDADPKLHPEARRYTTLSLQEALQLGLQVMDATALALCATHGLPLRVYDATQPGALLQVLEGASVGTYVHP